MPTVKKKVMNEAKTAALLISLIISFVYFAASTFSKNLFQPSFIFFVEYEKVAEINK